MDDQDSNQFEMQNEDDVRIVYFKRKPNQRRKIFHIGILAKKFDGNSTNREEIFRLYVKLTIVP